ncbi:MAG: hypothetical protein IPG76_23925 [Acidobacteria bacterium]|nr:hypothetical protein [Acidobacteriota bacterium]
MATGRLLSPGDPAKAVLARIIGRKPMAGFRKRTCSGGRADSDSRVARPGDHLDRERSSSDTPHPTFIFGARQTGRFPFS